MLLAAEEANQEKQGEEEAGPACAEPATEEGGGELKIRFNCQRSCEIEIYLSIVA